MLILDFFELNVFALNVVFGLLINTTVPGIGGAAVVGTISALLSLGLFMHCTKLLFHLRGSLGNRQNEPRNKTVKQVNQYSVEYVTHNVVKGKINGWEWLLKFDVRKEGITDEVFQ